jgi:hypothetical protein
MKNKSIFGNKYKHKMQPLGKDCKSYILVLANYKDKVFYNTPKAIAY